MNAAPLPVQLDTTGRQTACRPDALPDPAEFPHRLLHIAALRGLGFSLQAIGRTYGVSPQAISVMLTRHRAELRAAPRRSGLEGLSPRAANALGYLGINSRPEARTVTDWEVRLHGVRNCGRKTIAEIREWAAGRGGAMVFGGGSGADCTTCPAG